MTNNIHIVVGRLNQNQFGRLTLRGSQKFSFAETIQYDGKPERERERETNQIPNPYASKYYIFGLKLSKERNCLILLKITHIRCS